LVVWSVLISMAMVAAFIAVVGIGVWMLRWERAP
jgi:hypothetical protein